MEPDVDLSESPSLLEMKIKEEELVQVPGELNIKQEVLDLDEEGLSHAEGMVTLPTIDNVFVKEEPTAEAENDDDSAKLVIEEELADRNEPIARTRDSGICKDSARNKPEISNPGIPKLILSIDIYQDQLVNQRLGMGLRRRSGGLLVSSVEPKGTAQVHGIKLGDMITEVENVEAPRVDHNFLMDTLTREGHMSLVIERETGGLNLNPNSAVDASSGGFNADCRISAKSKRKSSVALGESLLTSSNNSMSHIDPSLIENFPKLGRLVKVDVRPIDSKQLEPYLTNLKLPRKSKDATFPSHTCKVPSSSSSKPKSSATAAVKAQRSSPPDLSEDSDSREESLGKVIKSSKPGRKRGKAKKVVSGQGTYNFNMKTKKAAFKANKASKTHSISKSGQQAGVVTCGKCSKRFKSFLELGYHKIRCTGKSEPLREKSKEELSKELKEAGQSGEKEPAASSPASTDMSSKEIKDSQLILIRRNADLNQIVESLRREIKTNEAKYRQKIQDLQIKHKSQIDIRISEGLKKRRGEYETALHDRVQNELLAEKNLMKQQEQNAKIIQAETREKKLRETADLLQTRITEQNIKITELIQAKAKYQQDMQKEIISGQIEPYRKSCEVMIADFNKMKRLFIYLRSLVRLHFVPFTDKGVLIIKKLETLKLPKVPACLKSGRLVAQRSNEGVIVVKKQGDMNLLSLNSTGKDTSSNEDSKDEVMSATEKICEEMAAADTETGASSGKSNSDSTSNESRKTIEHINDIFIDDSDLIVQVEEVNDDTSGNYDDASKNDSMTKAVNKAKDEDEEAGIKVVHAKDNSNEKTTIDDDDERMKEAEEKIMKIMNLKNEDNTETVAISKFLKLSLMKAVKTLSDENTKLKKISQRHQKVYTVLKAKLRRSANHNKKCISSSDPAQGSIGASSPPIGADEMVNNGGSSNEILKDVSPQSSSCAPVKLRILPACKKLTGTADLTRMGKAPKAPPPLVPIASTTDGGFEAAVSSSVENRNSFVSKESFEALQEKHLAERQNFLALSGQYERLRKMSIEIMTELESMRRQKGNPAEDDRKSSIIKSQASMIKMLTNLNDDLVERNNLLQTGILVTNSGNDGSGGNSVASTRAAPTVATSTGPKSVNQDMMTLASKVHALKSVLSNIDMTCSKAREKDYKRLCQITTGMIESPDGLVNLRLLKDDTIHQIESRPHQIKVTEVCNVVNNSLIWKDRLIRMYEAELKAFGHRFSGAHKDGSANAPIEISEEGENSTSLNLMRTLSGCLDPSSFSQQSSLRGCSVPNQRSGIGDNPFESIAADDGEEGEEIDVVGLAQVDLVGGLQPVVSDLNVVQLD